jgi:predicted dehydrogenase
MKRIFLLIIPVFIIASCGQGGPGKKTDEKLNAASESQASVKLITVDPGHFHAALVQKSMYEQVSPDVHVYAPEGPDCKLHLDRIKAYNERPTDPTRWNEIVYTGSDFFDRMLAEKAGNVVVLSGNNKKKAEYIFKSINAGLNVFADKPMIISPDDFPGLKEAFRVATEKGLLLYDIMTERFEITTILQKELAAREAVFGKLQTGTRDDPAVSKISVHHYSKLVSGVQLIRPAWYYDVEQQGEGIVDVTTHLVDMVQWECFPEQILSPDDVSIVSARHWPTIISKEEFKRNTGLDSYPDYLKKDLKGDKLNVFANGEFVYQLKNIFAKVSVEWRFEAPPGGGDTHYSVMKGSKCDLAIRQGANEKYVPTLYVEKIKSKSGEDFMATLKEVLASLPYEGLAAEPAGKNTIKIVIPGKYRVGHEEHFAQVTRNYLKYLAEGKLPEWEIQGMITKYYTTTSALKKARGEK